MKRPKDVYKKSRRRWDGKEAEQEYKGKMKVRMVNDRGFFNLHQRRIFMGNPFAGYYIGIKEMAGGKSEIWFNNFSQLSRYVLIITHKYILLYL
jgi:hypothetical protein